MRTAAPLLAGALAACAPAADLAPAPGENAQTYRVEAVSVARDEALATALNTLLLQGSSATTVLERWCAERYIADPPVVVAVVDRSVHEPATAATRMRLGVGPAEAIAYRRVQLRCGAVVLSIADNWYVPGRLTPEMRAALAGDAPFGRVILPLAPRRETIAAELHWRGQRPGEVLRHHARVVGGDGVPLAEVVETYQSGIAAGED